MPELYAGIEAGGTKIVCAVGAAPDKIVEEIKLPTRDPQTTLSKARQFFLDAQDRHGELKSLGIGSFGPIDLNPLNESYGRLSTTPKPGWSGVNLVEAMADLHIPVLLDTDTNAAALAEYVLGAGRGLSSLLYITVGTGVGAGIVLDGAPVHGLSHPEAGHILLRTREGETFQGACSYHGACLEGMISGPSIAKKWGRAAEDLPAGHPCWDEVAWYLAQGLSAMLLTLSPERIVLGGGVMQQDQIFPLVRSYIKEHLAGYIDNSKITDVNSGYIVEPGLGTRSGITGALILAERCAA